MIPDPLHPAVVHLPIALALLAPLAAAALFWAIRVGRAPARAWIGVVALQAILVGSAWLALETGEREEEKVERIVAERFIEEHEESAERFMILAGLTIPLAAAGLLRHKVAGVARGFTVLATVAAALLMAFTGHKGGELVYRHGAGAAYVEQGAAGSASGGPTYGLARGAHEDDDDD